ncbi:protein CgeA [Bacillus sp. OTU530]|jgi:transcription antitermination factor NusG|uniref:protein CgeA n=1 Tax=Bacillus sp. OTU530 TaxID=3043862 RepID=UPI00313C8EB3
MACQGADKFLPGDQVVIVTTSGETFTATFIQFNPVKFEVTVEQTTFITPTTIVTRTLRCNEIVSITPA